MDHIIWSSTTSSFFGANKNSFIEFLLTHDLIIMAFDDSESWNFIMVADLQHSFLSLRNINSKDDESLPYSRISTHFNRCHSLSFFRFDTLMNNTSCNRNHLFQTSCQALSGPLLE